jgi:hypothetical protein
LVGKGRPISLMFCRAWGSAEFSAELVEIFSRVSPRPADAVGLISSRVVGSVKCKLLAFIWEAGPALNTQQSVKLCHDSRHLMV